MAQLNDRDKTIGRIVMILGMLHEDKRTATLELSKEFNVAIEPYKEIFTIDYITFCIGFVPLYGKNILNYPTAKTIG